MKTALVFWVAMSSVLAFAESPNVVSVKTVQGAQVEVTDSEIYNALYQEYAGKRLTYSALSILPPDSSIVLTDPKIAIAGKWHSFNSPEGGSYNYNICKTFGYSGLLGATVRDRQDGDEDPAVVDSAGRFTNFATEPHAYVVTSVSCIK